MIRPPLPMWGVRLECGHQGTCAREPKIGSWISCRPVCHPGPSCQAQRKVTEVWQIALFTGAETPATVF